MALNFSLTINKLNYNINLQKILIQITFKRLNINKIANFNPYKLLIINALQSIYNL